MNIRMSRNFIHDVADQPGVTRTLPAGWVGEVDDELGQAVIDDGAGENADPKPEKPVKVEK